MPAGMRILIVDDDADVSEMLRNHLEREGYVCQHVNDGHDAMTAVRRDAPDLILLDRVLPGLTGDEVAQRLKADPRTRAIPIIMLTGKDEESDTLVGFALGADDYVNKPFSVKVLLARITAQLRRRAALEQEHEALAPPPRSVILDRGQARVFVDRTPIPLTAAEYRILATLMAAGGHVLHWQQLAAVVYGKESPPDEHTLEGHVGGLRRKMGPAAACIQMVADGEYAFCPPGGEQAPA